MIKNVFLTEGSIETKTTPVWLTLQHKREFSPLFRKKKPHFLLPDQRVIANNGVWRCLLNPLFTISGLSNKSSAKKSEENLGKTNLALRTPSLWLFVFLFPLAYWTDFRHIVNCKVKHCSSQNGSHRAFAVSEPG